MREKRKRDQSLAFERAWVMIKVFPCMGSVVLVMQSSVVETDPFAGGELWEIISRPAVAQATSKVTSRLEHINGTVLEPPAASCLAKASYLGNVARHIHDS